MADISQTDFTLKVRIARRNAPKLLPCKCRAAVVSDVVGRRKRSCVIFDFHRYLF